MNNIKLAELLRATTVVLSKGERTRRYLVAMGVASVLSGLMPSVEDAPGLDIVDCQFLSVGVDLDEAARRVNEFMELVGTLPAAELQKGITYKHLAPYVHDDVTALRVFALGHALGLWHVVLPADTNIEPSIQDEAAALGWLHITPYSASGFRQAVG
jgi:hypothetical protein